MGTEKIATHGDVKLGSQQPTGTDNFWKRELSLWVVVTQVLRPRGLQFFPSSILNFLRPLRVHNF